VITDLTKLKEGESGTVFEIRGGRGLLRRLESLGIRPGVVITKITAQFMGGPIAVRLGNSRIALGFGMAKKIMIQINNR
jgi:ferrous iron transport protein A